VLVITAFDLDEYIIEALRAGASGFLVKDSTPEELIHAFRVIVAGYALLSPPITKRLLDLRAGMLPPMTPRRPCARRPSTLPSASSTFLSTSPADCPTPTSLRHSIWSRAASRLTWGTYSPNLG
jgi:hypothetical protein